MDGTSDDIKELSTLLSVITAWWLYLKKKKNLLEMQMKVFTGEMT